jgi:glycosyltransferase involved in cell wall biosynthesis
MDKRLLKAIASVTQFSELLILDNASGITKKDVTHDNCKIHTLSDHPITDFSAVRNKALQLASEKWVFFLDSDEVLQPFSVRKLSKVLATTQHHGLNCTRSDFFLGKQLRYGEAGNQKIIRLLRACHTTFTGKIHEVAQVTGSTGEVPLCIDHYSHQSISNFISDVSTYATLLGAEKKNSLPRLLFELLFYPPTKCMHTYVIKGGWRDGYRGLTYSLVMSLHSLIVRITAYEQNHT